MTSSQKKILEAREQIQQDLLTYLDGFPRINSHLTKICQIVVDGFKPLVKEPKTKKKGVQKKLTFQQEVNADDVTVACPCGESITGEGEPVLNFMRAHKPHTNGKCTQHLTADGRRFVSSLSNGQQTYTYTVK